MPSLQTISPAVRKEIKNGFDTAWSKEPLTDETIRSILLKNAVCCFPLAAWPITWGGESRNKSISPQHLPVEHCSTGKANWYFFIFPVYTFPSKKTPNPNKRKKFYPNSHHYKHIKMFAGYGFVFTIFCSSRNCKYFVSITKTRLPIWCICFFLLFLPGVPFAVREQLFSESPFSVALWKSQQSFLEATLWSTAASWNNALILYFMCVPETIWDVVLCSCLLSEFCLDKWSQTLSYQTPRELPHTLTS